MLELSENTINLITKRIDKVFDVHVHYCHHDEDVYIENFFISKDGVHCCGEDVINHLYNQYGLSEVDCKVVITKWIGYKVNGENILENPKFKNFWRKNRYYFESNNVDVLYGNITTTENIVIGITDNVYYSGGTTTSFYTCD